ncbi:MAG: hypothetical protein ABF461_01960 [Zymomonas mobilis subsp. pomaceae]|uniref:Lipoprotein n=1 Tax=Zymomonas mobilis subsp. pomaceae (strain ATCC 29192 / DSM 22645 / JCM 10191 / CCUG 17912 / NBRC 13757 / NCIMB 11200 / NRRL B-4491 / Barker I) TaxID=579138 RepID=F8ETA0_ZYMMT|nr:hypothetical protein [Zymomonas mobilis]AEI36990.1 hypothetical protein Zymop_0086 [Zymomonas mobilis subsp. pomaceae ATCC 29192]MDX5948363.1 hypothetical protein [Zymomonas mobilis subsp. pomaceae]GEB89649.1 hypothetical protein ZMO02_12860 [Zymomonas mobilis subsp. pomaceae]
MSLFKPRSALLLATPLFSLLLGGCVVHHGQFDEMGAMTVKRSSCPAVAVPDYTGDITLFDPPDSRTASALDVDAVITRLRPHCDEPPYGAIVTHLTFTVQARRRHVGGARDVTLPYFVAVMRAGTRLLSKQMGSVTVHFEPGQLTTDTEVTATSAIDHESATLPRSILHQLNKPRLATDLDASIDPTNDPKVRAAMKEASFEMLVGFQLTEPQLAYNATR